jgi:hypothetical protein
MSKNIYTNDRLSLIENYLRKQYQLQGRRKTLRAFFLSVSLFVVCLLLFMAAETIFYLPSGIKSVFLLLSIAAPLIFYFFLKRKIHLSPFSDFYENLLIQRGYERVANALDLHLYNREDTSGAFRKAAIEKNLENTENEKLFDEIRDYVQGTETHHLFKKSRIIFLSSIVLGLLLFVINSSATYRTLHFWQTYTQPNPFSYTIQPADTTISLNSELGVRAMFTSDERPENVTLLFKTDVEENFRERRMEPDTSGVFEAAPITVSSSISYMVEMDGFQSEQFRAQVQIQPDFDELQVTVTPPLYTSLPAASSQYPYSRLRVYPGTVLEFTGIANKPLESVQVTGNSVEEFLTATRDTIQRFTFEFQPEVSDTLRFILEDQDGLTNRNPFRTFIEMRADQPPVVVIREPEGTIMEQNPGKLDIFYEATDDFGITSAEIRWELRRAFTESPRRGSQSIPTPGNGPTTAYSLDLSSFELRPRDTFSAWIRVTDNDEVGGYKTGESREILVQIPSLTESFEQLDEKEQDVETELDNISEQFDSVEREYENFLEKLQQNPETGIEEEQMLEDLKERQEQIENTVQELGELFNEMRNDIEGNDQLSEQTKQSYRELQQLIEELDDPRLREAMEQLQEAIESLSPEQMENALDQMSFNEQLYKERIERTIELFKQLKMNSNLDRLASQYEDMAERMKDGAENSEDLEKRLNEMDTISDDLDSAEEQINSLDEQVPDRSRENIRRLQEDAGRELESIKKSMEDLKNQMNSEQNSETGSDSPQDTELQQQQIGEKMEQEADRFRSSMQQMSGQQIQINLLALQEALYRLLNLSVEQEELTLTTLETQNRSQGFVELARLQNNISEQFLAVSDTLFEISKELPGIPNQINEKKLETERLLERSSEGLVERDLRMSSVATRESLGGINDLTAMISSILNQLMNQQNSGMGSGSMSMQQMIEQMQNMSGDQQQLNQQLQNLINDMQGDRLSREQSERLDQIARQQNEIRKQLQELQQSGVLEDGDRMLSEMQRMLENMEDSINDMRGGITDPLMMERQQNILSRMLSAEESMQQRGEDEQREGTASDEYDRTLPPEMTLEELEQEIRARLQDPNYTRFSDEYRRLIELYFEQLRQMEESVLPQ